MDKIFHKQISYIQNLKEIYRNALQYLSYIETMYNKEFKYNNIQYDLYSQNKNLRDNKYIHDEVFKKYKLIDKIFKNLPKLEHNIILYRGISELSKEQFYNYDVSQILDINYYISASLDKTVAKNFACYGNYRALFEIEIPEGSKILPLNYSLYEVIIDENHKFLIKSIDRKRKNIYIKCILI